MSQDWVDPGSHEEGVHDVRLKLGALCYSSRHNGAGGGSELHSKEVQVKPKHTSETELTVLMYNEDRSLHREAIAVQHLLRTKDLACYRSLRKAENCPPPYMLQ